MSNNIGKADGFKDEEYIIIPTESFADYAEHPLVRTLRGFPAAGISAGYVGTDVRLHGIRYRVLYARLLFVGYYHCSPYIYGV